MSGKKNDTPDKNGIAFLYVPPSETKGTHLAHWPPPRFERETTPIMAKHAAGEPVHVARPRGWRLTREAFAEFADDED